MLCDVIIAKDKRPYEIQYHITHGFVNVCYIYQDVNETFKYKFINDFYKNKLTKCIIVTELYLPTKILAI